MLRYDELKRNPRKLLALAGLTPEEFQILLPAFERAYEQKHPVHRTLVGRQRKRRQGGGRKGSLDSPEQKLLFILVYQKTYPMQTLLGEVFNLSQARANYWIHRLLPILKVALDELGVPPERNPPPFARRERRRAEALAFDGAERRCPRLENSEKQTWR